MSVTIFYILFLISQPLKYNKYSKVQGGTVIYSEDSDLLKLTQRTQCSEVLEGLKDTRRTYSAQKYLEELIGNLTKSLDILLKENPDYIWGLFCSNVILGTLRAISYVTFM